MSDLDIYGKLCAIQSEIKVPKTQFSDYGNFYYRSAESILEALKPILSSYKTLLILSDEIVQIGDRYYIRAIAKLYDLESDEFITNTAYAREALTEPKKSESQITGTASSYARKYALNGLFLLDDNKDADATETPDTARVDLLNDDQIKAIQKELNRTNVAESTICDFCHAKALTEIPQNAYESVIKKLAATPTAKTGK